MKEAKIIIGANFGDEGKGLMTDYFAKKASDKGQSCLVICHNGGAQKGHTVNTSEGLRHIFHHFGSGLFAEADTYLAKTFILNPILFVREWKELNSYNCEAYQEHHDISDEKRHKHNVFINGECMVTTPFDMMLNQLAEEGRGDSRHGSCGLGIYETILRNQKKPLTWNMLLSMKIEEQKIILLQIHNEYVPERIKELGIKSVPKNWEEILSHGEEIIDEWLLDVKEMATHVNVINDKAVNLENCAGKIKNESFELIDYDENTIANKAGNLEACIKPSELINSVDYGLANKIHHSNTSKNKFTNSVDYTEITENELLDLYDCVIFEGAQGLLLDQNNKAYLPHLTPSNTGIKNPVDIIGNQSCDIEVCYVTRTYLTRHGAGRFDTECKKNEINKDMVDLTNVPNPYQETIRYGKIDKNLGKRIFEDCEKYKDLIKISVSITHLNESRKQLKEIERQLKEKIPNCKFYYSDGESRENIVKEN